MQGIWLENQELSFREDIPEPELSEGEALIRTRLAGICSTDLELVRGYYPYSGVLGHEFVGEVVEAPSAEGLEGKRVVGEINAVCGECVHCRQGRPRHCLNRTTLGISGRDGVFGEFFTLPVENLLIVPESIPDRKAVFVEPLAAAVEIIDQTHIKPTDSVLVVGAGRLGQLISQVLCLTGCDLKVVVRHDHQRHLLEGRGICTISEEEVPSGSADVVVDATGVPGGFKVARQAVRPRGKFVLKSTYAENLTFDASALVVDEISLIGSRCGPFEPALRLIEKNLVDPSILISEELPLSAGLRAFQRAKQPGVLKVVLTY
ncbi:MAG: MDR/zinc-dependent alcohol dehydrogenase-like family protein [Chloroflexota bacterium]